MKNQWLVYYCLICREHWPVRTKELLSKINDERECPGCGRIGVRDSEHSGSYPKEKTHA